ncbi:MAG: MoxR family ATPase, partial [Myxococcales bacterium]|nr:MoxR family ATPase [Myxococcales bacterium]
RTSPKVQAALLEAMAEKQVTVDNVSHRLDDLFFVIATQNPLDLAGTFPLPAAQLDRFLFKIRMHHIAKEAELDILANLKQIKAGARQDLESVTRSEILATRRVIEEQVHVSPLVHHAIVAIAEVTRTDPRILQGISTRSLVLMIPALQAHALMNLRDHVTADDVRALALHVLGHRMELAPGAGRIEAAVDECVAKPLEILSRQTLRR